MALVGEMRYLQIGDSTYYIPGLYIASYGSSTYAEVLAAYQANKIVYCRASSNSNPGTGSQNRMAFLAYVNNSTTPTEFEFQYYRSVSSHSDSQQGDQVYVYTLNSSGTWSVTTREAYTKVKAGTNMSSSYSNGVITLNATMPTVPSAATATPLVDGTAAVGSSTKYALEDHVHPTDTSRAAAGLGISSASAGQVVKISSVDSSGVPTAYTSVDITHCCEATLSAEGWYRAIVYNAYDSYSALGYSGEIVTIKVVYTSAVSCQHIIKLFMSYNKIVFLGEESHGTTNILDKIRYTVNGSKGYVDIHWSSSTACQVNVSFEVASRTYAQGNWIASGLTAVADSPTGETVVTTYNFSANKARGRYLIYTGTAQSGTVPMTDNIYNYDLLVLTCMTNVDTYVFTLSPNQFIGNNWICSASAGPIEGGFTYNSSLSVAPANSGGSLALSVSSNNVNWSLHLHRVEGIIL